MSTYVSFLGVYLIIILAVGCMFAGYKLKEHELKQEQEKQK